MSHNVANNTLRAWQETAPFWAKHSATIRKMFAPVTKALIAQTGIVEGQDVLDVAGGPGEPSLTIAEAVGPKGTVTCTDATAEMVAAAEAEAKRREITNVQFHQCSADSLPFIDESFDVTVSRLGVMFFPDPVAGCREMLRVTKSNGALGFAVWHKPELNPFSFIVTEVMSQHVQSPAADPDAPGAFRFAESGKLVKVLKQAGATEIDEKVLKFHIEAPISPAEFWAMRSETSETLRAKLLSLPDKERTKIGVEVQEAAVPFFPNNRMKFPAQMLIVTAKKRM